MTAAIEMRGIVKHFGPVIANNGVSLRVEAGEIRISGEPVVLRSPADAIARGVGMVSQHFSLVPAFTAAENIALGDRGGVVFDRTAAESGVRAYADRYGLAVQLASPVGLLSVGEQQR